jgi:antitoxin component YwqK of YwqJK toxin-antitoxin module
MRSTPEREDVELTDEALLSRVRPTLEVRRAHDATNERVLRKWSVLTYPDGRALKHGRETTYYPDGTVKSERDFWEGRKQGRWASYFPGGRPETDLRYREGEPFGTWTRWYENGKKRSEVTYAEGAEGDEHPEAVFWHANGQMSARGPSDGGKRQAEWTFWWPNGTKREQGTYVDGLRDGVWTMWNENGTKEAEGRFVRGERTGTWAVWPDGEGPVETDMAGSEAPREPDPFQLERDPRLQ